MIPTSRPFRLAVLAALALAPAAACTDGSGPEEPTPAITHLNPTTLLQWTENGVDLTVTGSGFREGALVRLNGEGQYTTYVSQSQLVAQIPEFLTEQARTFQVSVLNPGAEGKASGIMTLPVEHRRPDLHAITPVRATQGDGAFALTVQGVSFAQGAVVRWNGADRPTTFVHSRMLTAQIPATDLAQPGMVQVTVFNPAPGGGEAPPQPFEVVVRPNPIPTVTGLTPEAVTIATAAEFTVRGVGFMPGSQVWVGELAPATTVVSPTELRFALSASNLPRPGLASVRVVNPPPGGGSSNAVTLRVENPVPVLSALTPAQVVIGGPDVTVRLTGAGFAEEAVVLVGGSFVEVARRDGSTGLEIVLPAREVDEVATYSIQVMNPGPGGGSSGTLTFSVVNPAPVIQAISPSQMQASPHFINLAVQVTGTGFIPGTVVRVNGSVRPTEYLSGTELEALLAGGDLDEPGTLSLDAVNPSPGGGVSAPVTFIVTEPPPLPPPGLPQVAP